MSFQWNRYSQRFFRYSEQGLQVIRHAFLTLFLLVPPYLCLAHGHAQTQPLARDSQEPILHISSDLVLVDVEALSTANGHPIDTLKQADFQIFDNDKPVSIKTFDVGASARPLALWFVVQCKMNGWEAQGSGLFVGQIERFQPALQHLEKRDRVAVAHWCDNGQAQVDLPPTGDINQAVTSLNLALVPATDKVFHDRPGELALQKTLQLIVDATRSMPTESVPVIVFLYGDYSAMRRSEANQFIDELLDTSVIAFGLRDRRSPRFLSFMAPGEQASIANYIANQTGGEYLWVTPDTYASGLIEILEQLHSRYELGFRPGVLDGKRHKLQVKLTENVEVSGRKIRLRCRAGYVAGAHAAR
jgi:hypothetical protein